MPERALFAEPVVAAEPALFAEPEPTPSYVRSDVTTPLHSDTTASLPLVTAPGKRKAVKHVGDRGPLFRGLPSVPVLVGIAALAVSAGGAVLAGGPGTGVGEPPRLSQASALSGASAGSTVNLMKDKRRQVVSRDHRRDALADAADQELQAAVEKQYEAHTGALQSLAKEAGKFAAVLEENKWVLPLSGYRLTARFGEYGLWSSYHTGLDFAAPTGTPINAVANGTVTETGYDGAYGNKTVVTLEDGTELWYCHQTTIDVNVGDVVRAGEHLGTVGSTGNVTGPHLHLEVRPGAGDPVDPYSAMVVNGVTP
ncbi:MULTISPECIES: M23 family metallopeptidase [unclassified Nocardioides]|uniref:M23 family metallopeptidase n=1 Tax=unclassified Nocardioides TaxID=2615069 RepID=UPI0030145FD7